MLIHFLSMHDNRWKADNEEETEQKEELTKGKEKPVKEKTEVTPNFS